MATAAKSNDHGTPRTRRIRVSQDARQAERAARAETPPPALPTMLRVSLVSAGDLPLGAIVPEGYRADDRTLFRVIRPAAPAEPTQATEPVARHRDFRAWLWEVKRERGADVFVGRAGDARCDPIASWLRETRGYHTVSVRSGTAQSAHFVTYDQRGAPLGMGYLDYGLTLALDWLDSAGLDAHGAPRLLTAGDVLALLAEMSVAWPSPERQTPLPEPPEPPHPVRRVGIANER